MEKSSRIIPWVIMSLVFLYAFQFAFHDIRTIVNLQFDDAYYYLTIARSIAAGKGATFDGIHKTNGFHPLWLLVLSGFASVPGLGLTVLARATVILQAALFFCSLVLLKKILNGLLHPLLISAVLLIPLYPRFFHIFTVGMESGLLILLLLLSFWLFYGMLKRINADNWFLNSLALGGLSAAIVLTRLDAVVFPAAFLVALVVYGLTDRGKPGRSLSGALVAGSVIVVGLLPFLLWNYANFGTFLTISSALKVKWGLSKLGFNLPYFLANTLEYHIGVFIALSAAVLLWKAGGKSEAERRRFVFPLSVFVFPSLIVLVFFLLFVKWALFAYAYASTLPAVILGAGGVLILVSGAIKPEARRRKFAIAVLAAGCVAAVGLQAFSLSRLSRSQMMRIYDAAVWARENTPEDAVFAMKDCGAFGYYSERRTINLDGMVNDFEYQEYLRRGELEEYLRMNGVDFFVQHAFWDRDDRVNEGDYEEYSLFIPCRVYKGEGGTVTVKKRNEVFRSEYYVPRTEEPTRVIIWKYE